MELLQHSEQQSEGFCIGWMPDGKSFVIRNQKELTSEVLPKFFRASKFSSFTRKLYRWQFRQINRGVCPNEELIFGNDFFRRDEPQLLRKMRSVTAASTRRAIIARKRASEAAKEERDIKQRMMMHRMMQPRMSPSAHSFGYDNKASFGLKMNPKSLVDTLPMMAQSRTPLLHALQAQTGHQMNEILFPHVRFNQRFADPRARHTAALVEAAIGVMDHGGSYF